MRATPSRAVLALTLAFGLYGAIPVQAADAPAAAASQPANVVRAVFAAPFNAAQELVKAGKGAEALAKLKEVAALPDLTPYEQYLIVRVRAPAEYTAGDMAAAAADFDKLLSSDQLPAADRMPILHAYAQLLYSNQQYDKAQVWMQRYIDAGGDDPQMRELLPQTYYINKDYAGAAKLFKTQVDAFYAAGKTPPEKTLRLLASSLTQAGDDAGYLAALEHLAVDYPKADYWKELVARAGHADKFADRLYVDFYRLKTATLGQVSDSERLTYASLASRAGFPSEAKRVLDDGFTNKAFAGADLGEATKLRDQATRGAAQDKSQLGASENSAKASKDGNALVGQGLLEALDGDAARGAALIEQGIAKGGLKYAEDARLHLGMAQLRAGRNTEALKTFQSVNGADGLGALAHVWTLYAQSQIKAAAAPAAPVATK